MVAKNKRRKKSLEDRYRLESPALRRFQPSSGRPAMWEATDVETGERVLVKEWQRRADVSDSDLREIWRHEIRQLQRLAACPGSHEYLVNLIDADQDDGAFYLILSAGPRLPLQWYVDNQRGGAWIQYPRQIRNRLHIWENLRRIALGLDILHSQGLLHRDLDMWSVFTEAGNEPDFKLSGFEWSLRLSGGAGRKVSGRTSDEISTFSFLQDWESLGELACKMLGISASSFTKTRMEAEQADRQRALHSSERSLLRLLLRSDEFERIDGEVVREKIDAIVQGLQAEVAGTDAKLCMALLLGSQSGVSREIRKASYQKIEMDDVAGQLSFIRDDLSEDPLLIKTSRSADEAEVSFSLQGQHLLYELRPYSPDPRRTQPKWDVAYCHSIKATRPSPNSIRAQHRLSGLNIDVATLGDISNRYTTLQGKTRYWDELIPAASNISAEWKGGHFQALILIHALSTLRMAAEIWPVEKRREEQNGDLTVVTFVYRADSEREDLAKALGMESPAKRMLDAFSSDQSSIDGDWVIQDSGMIGDPGRRSARWSFVEVKTSEAGETLYIFEASSPAPIGNELFLTEGNFQGSYPLIRRQLNAIKALGSHEELLNMIVDPRGSIRSSHDEVSLSGLEEALDPSKLKALDEIWKVLPLYLVQGPPGVGKTRLVRELVAKLYESEDSIRVLLSAQSHAAVDHLLESVSEVLGKNSEKAPIVVRCRSRDRNEAPSEFDISKQTRTVLEGVCASPLYREVPERLKTRASAILEAGKAVEGEEQGDARSVSNTDRSLEALVLRSANFIFATTNARQLEQLIDERAQADWSIVEEAGKATGVELLSPLMLSHRRLMIGDHRQLPPFGSKELLDLLRSPEGVRSALRAGHSYVDRLFQDVGFEELIDHIEDEANLTELCGEAARKVVLFEAMISSELEGATNRPQRVPIGIQLSHQHRMHPAIAKLVSDTFYRGALQTDPSCRKRFESSLPPIESIAPAKLPDTPIVFVDMPFVQSAIGVKSFEERPSYSNPDEVEAVADVLSLIRARVGLEKAPSLAVLSPYRRQVAKLKERIGDAIHAELAHLRGFEGDATGDVVVGTVDSFQGDEADVVVISLVRNNQHAGRRGLGFLADPRRMNVLLSRAKWKLVLVGSLDFLNARFESQDEEPADEGLAALFKLLRGISALETKENEFGATMASIVKIADLRGVDEQ